MKTHPRLEKILAFLATQDHKFVSFRFTKKDGTTRHLLARIELARQLAARYPFAFLEQGKLPVRDLVIWRRTHDVRRSSKFVNCTGPVEIKAGGDTFHF